MGQFVFSVPEVLAIAEEAELKSTIKRARGRPHKRPIEAVEAEEEEEELENESSELGLELDTYIAPATQSRRAGVKRCCISHDVA